MKLSAVARAPSTWLLMAVVCCCSPRKITEASTSSATTANINQESVLRDSVVDLKRIGSPTGSQQVAQQQPAVDQIASANHESVSLDGGSSALLSRLLLAGDSSPMPIGKRRLDQVDERLLSTSNDQEQQQSAQPADLFLASPETLLAAASRAPNDQYSDIVDNGPRPEEMMVGRLPEPALVAKMTNDNFNRMALASAMRFQQAQLQRAGVNAIGKTNRKRPRQQKQQQQQQQLQKRAMMMRQQESRQRLVASTKRDKTRDQEEGDGLDDRSDYDDTDDVGAADEADSDGEAEGRYNVSPKRRSSSPSGSENSDDDFFNDREDKNSDQPPEMRRPRPPLRQAASRQLSVEKKRRVARPMNAMRRSSAPSGRQDHEKEQLLLQQLKEQQLHPTGQHQDQNMDVLASTSQAGEEQVADDDLSAASHVRSSATDLQSSGSHGHGHHDHYYQYVEVPKKKAWKFGFKRGNSKHEIMGHEKGHKHKFHTEFKWHAKEKCKKHKCKSIGHMKWEYKHAKHHHGR